MREMINELLSKNYIKHYPSYLDGDWVDAVYQKAFRNTVNEHTFKRYFIMFIHYVRDDGSEAIEAKAQFETKSDLVFDIKVLTIRDIQETEEFFEKMFVSMDCKDYD